MKNPPQLQEHEDVTPDTWWADWKRPFNIVSLIIGIFGTVYGIVAYYDSHKVEQLGALRSVTKIYDKTSYVKSITIHDKNNNLIDDNVYLSSIIMWNAGNVNIGREKIKKAMRFYISGSGRILEYGISNNIGGDIPAFALATIDPADNVRSLTLTWDFFGKKMGYSATIIYTGEEDTNLNIDVGYIEDMDKLIEWRQPATTEKINISILAGTAFIGVLTLGVIDYFHERKRIRYMQQRLKELAPGTRIPISTIRWFLY